MKNKKQEQKSCRLWKGCSGPRVSDNPSIKCGQHGEVTFNNPVDYYLRFHLCVYEKEKCPVYRLEKALKE